MAAKLIPADRDTKLYLHIDPQHYNPRALESLTEDIIHQLEKKIYKNYDIGLVQRVVAEKRFGENVLLIEGKLPEEGHDGYIKYNFDIHKEEFLTFEKMLKSGQESIAVEEILTRVKKGEVLAEVIPPQEGKNGVDIYNNTIKAKEVSGVSLNIGKNVVFSEDKTKAIASLDGIVFMDKEKICVDPLTEIKAVTDKEFKVEGALIISAALSRDTKVTATGTVIVQATVSDAHIESGRHILIGGGILSNGSLKAKGDVLVLFSDQSAIQGNHIFLRDHLFNSKVTAFGGIDLIGGKGVIIGGEIHSYGTINVLVLGSEKAAETKIVLGLTAKELDEKGYLTAECVSLKNKMKAYAQQVEQYKKLVVQKQKLGAPVPVDLKNKLMSIQKEAVTFINDAVEQMKSKSEKVDYYNKLFDRALKASINVRAEVYSGVRLNINGKLLEIYKVLTNKAFRLEGHVIVY